MDNFFIKLIEFIIKINSIHGIRWFENIMHISEWMEIDKNWFFNYLFYVIKKEDQNQIKTINHIWKKKNISKWNNTYLYKRRKTVWVYFKCFWIIIQIFSCKYYNRRYSKSQKFYIKWYPELKTSCWRMLIKRKHSISFRIIIYPRPTTAIKSKYKYWYFF